ncbi:MAG: hypothetical protein QM287_02870 [Bacillota bacterium]|nr:hypothetical protein [Bacillota bacterium]
MRIGMFLHALDRQPLSLALTENTLIAHRSSKSEVIDRADITEVELLLELPENMTRSWEMRWIISWRVASRHRAGGA